MSSFHERLQAVLAITDEGRRAEAFLRLQCDLTEHLYREAGLPPRRMRMTGGLFGH